MTAIDPLQWRTKLAGVSVFVAASIPSPARWDGSFDPLAITDAVVAVARAVLSSGGRLVTAAHPTIAPLLLYVAAEQPPTDEPLVVLYQSEVFQTVWPRETFRFEEEGIGRVVRTERVGDEPADPPRAPRSLDLMRRRLLDEEELAAAVFVGGMHGIPDEYAQFRARFPAAPTYSFGRPGGAASALVDTSPPAVRPLLAEDVVYPAVARAIVDDIATHYPDR